MFLKFPSGILFVLWGVIFCGRCDDFPPPEVKAFVDGLHDICIKKLGLPDDITKDFDFTTKRPGIMCYFKCLMVEGKWAGEDEIPYFEDLLEHAHPLVKPHVELMVQNCRTVPAGTEECETIYNFLHCAYKVDPKHFYMP